MKVIYEVGDRFPVRSAEIQIVQSQETAIHVCTHSDPHGLVPSERTFLIRVLLGIPGLDEKEFWLTESELNLIRREGAACAPGGESRE